MHPYILNKRISSIFAWLMIISVICALIVPANLKLICFGLFFVFLVLFLVFMDKALSQNKEEAKIVKKNLDNEFKLKLNDLKWWLIFLGIVIVIGILKALF